MIMQAALSSVNLGLNSKPSLLKNCIDRFRSRTGKLTKISRERFCAMDRFGLFPQRLGLEAKLIDRNARVVSTSQLMPHSAHVSGLLSAVYVRRRRKSADGSL